MVTKRKMSTLAPVTAVTLEVKVIGWEEAQNSDPAL